MQKTDENNLPEGAIAIIGIGCRLPGASDAASFWANVRDGVESIVEISDEDLRKTGVSEKDLDDPNYVKRSAFIEKMEMFDAGFFGFSPKEASIMDPQHRQFLESSWEAFENAGYNPEVFEGAIGVFAGCGMNTYFTNHLAFNESLMKDPGYFLVRHTGNDKDFLPTRVAYQFDLKGPSVSVQTACSTSLVAVHLAVQSLLAGETDMVLAGGATIELPHRQGYPYIQGEILSHDGHCRSFEADSTGTVFGSGSGVVLLKRLEDAIRDGDHIYATILGSAINNDGSNKVSFLAPSVDGQANAITEALAVSNIDADTITYVEAHGTGTQIGDPIEVAALTQAFRESTDTNGFCALGAVKSNIGHLDTAAGIAGMIKTVMSLENKQLAPTLHFKKPNPKIDFAHTPFYVNAELKEWKLPEGINYRRATVNSLGVGGTNAHVVLEEAPELEPSDIVKGEQLIVLSARTKQALDGITEKLANFLEKNPETNLADCAYTLQIGRKAFRNRRVIAVKDTGDAIACLKSKDKDRLVYAKATDNPSNLVFMFPGGGAQYSGMGVDLYENQPVYRRAWDECIDHLDTDIASQIRSLVFASRDERPTATKELERPSLALPALLATEYALAKLLESWGARPSSFIGHSMGEYAAACFSGVMSIRDAVRLVRIRGVLFEKVERGGMLSVTLSESETRSKMPSTLDIAAANAPELCVASGPVEDIVKFQAQLEAEEIDCTRIHIDVAAHSSMLESILEEFREFCHTIDFSVPQIPFASNLTGSWITADQASDPEYWVQHLRNTVKFAENIETVLGDGSDYTLVEIGPGRTLSSLAKAGEKQAAASFNSMRHPKETYSDVEIALRTFGRIWASGVEIDWNEHWRNQRRLRIPLPTYAFDHSVYWVEESRPSADKSASEYALRKRPNIDDWFELYAWAQSGTPKPKEKQNANWLVFADSNGLSSESIKLVQGIDNLVTVTAGESFFKSGDNTYSVNPDSEKDFATLFEDLAETSKIPNQIAYFWSADENHPKEFPSDTFDSIQSHSFWGLFNLSKALSELDQPMDVAVISSNTHSISGEPSVAAKSTLLGPIFVLPHEVPGINAKSVDVDLSTSGESPIRAAAKQISRELTGEDDHRVVAYRGGHRWIRNLESAHLDSELVNQEWIRKGGAYIISGGLGGIGLVMAKMLAQKGAGRILLLGRSGLPAREEWDDYLATHSSLDRNSNRIRRVQEIESLGSTVGIAIADVSNEASVVSAISEAAFGDIHGVIHAAGSMDDQIIALKSRDSAERVLSSKAKGAIALDTATKNEPLDFFIVFSSVASFLGLQGQIDYAAANAFLDTFAREREARGPGRSIAINWNAWRDVGMAVEASLERSTGNANSAEKLDTGHPALGDAIILNENSTCFSKPFEFEQDWLINEHKVKNAEALIPGTGFIDLFRAASDYCHQSEDSAIELNDVQFVSPFQVSTTEKKTLNIKVEKDNGGFSLLAYSESEDNPHATGHGRNIKTTTPSPVSLDEIKNRCTTKGSTKGKFMDQEFLDFGPRWGCLNSIHYGDKEALIEIELPSEFEVDLNQFKLHPALLDMATGSAQNIIEGFSPETDFYVPLAYEKVLAYRDLPARFASHVVWKPGKENDLAKYDVTLFDPKGNTLVAISDFTMKRLDKDSNVTRTGSSARQQQEDNLLETILREAIEPHEGVDALDRVMSRTEGAQWIISSVDAKKWRLQLDEESRKNAEMETAGDQDEGATRPAIDSDYVAPGNEIEKTIASIWEAILGVKGVGVDDDFFELGGHSLLLTRTAARIRKEMSINLPLSVMFNSPTISHVAKEIEKLKSDDSGAAAMPELKAISRERFKSRRKVAK